MTTFEGFKDDEKFEKSIKSSAKHFNANAFFSKISKSVKYLSTETIYYSFLLFEVFQSRKVSQADALIIVGALGYLILPVDLIPDFIPVVGFADDTALILKAVSKIHSSIDEEVKFLATERMRKLGIFRKDFNEL
ncbi:YkvA family protein [Planococcus wigleyi]|uniref:DUF1232 domain-containing protein n=1 Tax=Planococcus wigleyi TaxID=2762216 RepID=A0ABR8WAZ7_9BACL|nr:YkvA family protein [Planococcus wigleyi]MBD8014213.1 DUF1232 domain-containing protein [Planococcus wigleyi]